MKDFGSKALWMIAFAFKDIDQGETVNIDPEVDGLYAIEE